MACVYVSLITYKDPNIIQYQNIELSMSIKITAFPNIREYNNRYFMIEIQ